MLLFVRRHKKTESGGPRSWIPLAPAEHVEHKSRTPMGITWAFGHEMPADVSMYSAIAAS
ncbi:hypothetical protein ACFYWO_09310 [Streptomyces sp. NPDC002932]|uniref:hypothetical protein n=1 Tax=Streptomyces sp. NPDC002932 TaxID=3364672 RepID=UPI0036A042E6